MTKILSINAGSSSLKFKLYEMPAETVIAEGEVERVNMPQSQFKLTVPDQPDRPYTETQDNMTYQEAVSTILTSLKSEGVLDHISEIEGIGNRVVAGGEIFKDAAVITPTTLNQIKELAKFAPLHNPVQIEYIEDFQKILPNATQVAVFDTSLFTELPATNYLYPLPYDYYEDYGARKYGAHGTSHRYVSHRAAEILNRPLKDQKMITLHLGSGSSATAFKDGRALDTSMGFTPLDGLLMGTRSGNIDPSLVAFLGQKMQMSYADVVTILNEKSGLLGVSGYSSDQRDLENTAAERPQSNLALEMYANRIVRYVGAYMAELGGLDTLVFTAGVGENSPAMRQTIANQLAFLGVKVADSLNQVRGKEQIISPADAKVTTMVVPTNEELMIARDTMRLMTNQK
ncbi:acetate/propionate family kinase [Levilactobacillus bambusae]|uniref:Acetate kinase n=1 Tax=Levilactobacillus bambusae TaxID=2024736 RepID=A0A2V1N1Y0_9LACO|nr:acetate kinase [Levilactobacillus bambusae]PWG00260.1 acetate kinase [Levilactobacillus bambusae]